MQATQRVGTLQGSPLRAPVWLLHGRRLAHAGLVMVLGLFIAFGPAAGQIFGQHYAWLREWVMFSGSGVGVLKGRFTLHHPGGADQPMTPLDVLGLRAYPDTAPDEFDRLVFGLGDLRRDATAMCDRRTDASRLSFEGWVGTRQGWRPLAAEDVCALPPSPPGDRSPSGGPFL